MRYDQSRLFEKILSPYKPHCRYLKTAHVKSETCITATGEFSISESCYIADTGHFNSVEFNICFNQLAYFLIAECIQSNLSSHFADWNIEKYFQYQLSDCLIARFHSSFRKPMRVDKFFGSIEIKNISVKNNKIFMDMNCHFHDEYGGASEGNAMVVVNKKC